ncbi:hypothetical protein Barb4_03540 [Bacteroidales bacterium Barb4]|nr:hypothetical protein Barb4_03540 [Bacteroidales bacterium Barb4]
MVFAKYPLSDDFAYEPEFELLYTELTGTISIYLEEHEFQSADEYRSYTHCFYS